MNTDNSVNLDEIIVGGLERRTWYVFVQAQLELLRSHVQEREKQIQESVNHYERAKAATHIDHGDHEYQIVLLEEHLGIEGPPGELRGYLQLLSKSSTTKCLDNPFFFFGTSA